MFDAYVSWPLSLPPTRPTWAIDTLSPEFHHREVARDFPAGPTKNAMMDSSGDTRTSPTLLRRAADWRDHAAWKALVERYDPLIQGWCREYHLDDEFAAEVRQRFWIELADKLRSFRYDPSRRFRGWLRRCFHWRVVDAIRERNREQHAAHSLDDAGCGVLESSLLASGPPGAEDDEPGPQRLLLLDLGEQVQAAVRSQVQPRTWQVFWHIAIDGWTTRQTADVLNMSYFAAHAAHKRVLNRLAEEGDRRLGALMGSITEARPA
jgi:RNA polymerase sigma-70 factor (ECF subfamily)